MIGKQATSLYTNLHSHFTIHSYVPLQKILNPTYNEKPTNICLMQEGKK